MLFASLDSNVDIHVNLVYLYVYDYVYMIQSGIIYINVLVDIPITCDLSKHAMWLNKIML